MTPAAMKVLVICESVWADGVVYDLHVLAEGLALRGHDVHVLDPGKYGGEPNVVEDLPRVFPDAHVSTVSPRFRPSGWPGYRVTDRIPLARLAYGCYVRHREIREFLRANAVDVILLYSGVRMGPQAVRLARRFGIPVVFRNVDKLYNLWPTWYWRTFAKRAEHYVYRRVDRTLALTPKYGDYLVRFGADRRDLSVLPFPIDVSKFHPAVDATRVREAWGITASDRVIAFVGTLYEFGGMLDFVERFPRVLRSVPDAKLLIVGDGAARPALDAAIARLGLGDRVVVTGYQPFDDMPHYIAAAELCINVFPINPRTDDIFSAKIVQYLACGKPTVSSALPGITTALSSEETGVVYAETIDGVADAVTKLLGEPDRRRHLAALGRCYVEQTHSQEVIVDQLENALRQAAHATVRESERVDA